MKTLLKLFGRIALILAAALLVVGIATLLQPAAPAFGVEGQRAGPGQNLQLPSGLPRAQGSAGMGRGRGVEAGGGHASGGLNPQETGELGRNTAQIALLMVPFAAWSVIARRRRHPALSRRERAAR